MLEPASGAEPPSVLALRQAVTPLSDLPGWAAPASELVSPDPPSITRLRAAIRSTETIRRRGELTKITAVLPGLIADARSAVAAHSGADGRAAQAVLAEAYQIAATTLAALGKEDAAFTAIERSISAARHSDDPNLETMAISSLSWVFMKQGRVDDAQRVAVRAAERIEPGFRSSPVELSVWGILLLRAASAAVRAGRPADAKELLCLASAAAACLGADQVWYATPFGPTNAGVAAVNAYVDMGEPAKAISHASRLTGLASLPPTWLARHYLDHALAYADMAKDNRATRALLAAERVAPEWMRYHATSHRLVAELLARERRRGSPIRHLARRLHLAD